MAEMQPFKIPAPDLTPFLEAVAEAARPIILGAIAIEAIEEVGRARAKHGKLDDLKFGNDPEASLIADLVVDGGLDLKIQDFPADVALEKAMQKINDDSWGERKTTRMGILLEEAFEALAAGNLADLRVELIQVIATALSIVADIPEEDLT